MPLSFGRLAVVGFAAFVLYNMGSKQPTAQPEAPKPVAATPAKSEEKPEPDRPTAGQEVSEEYFKWISTKMSWDCQEQIKRLVRHDMRTPGVFSGTNSMDSMFFLLRYDRWSKYVAADGTIKMRGDKAEAQNGLGNWMRVSYTCTVDINGKTVTDASLNDGRLN
jgi:hypothetical protein